MAYQHRAMAIHQQWPLEQQRLQGRQGQAFKGGTGDYDVGPAQQLLLEVLRDIPGGENLGMVGNRQRTAAHQQEQQVPAAGLLHVAEEEVHQLVAALAVFDAAQIGQHSRGPDALGQVRPRGVWRPRVGGFNSHADHPPEADRQVEPPLQ